MATEKKSEMTKAELMQQNKELLNRIDNDRPDLTINRVPKDTLEKFKDWAHDNFSGDYGMALKWLVDGIPNEQHRALQEQINYLAQELSKVKQELFNDEKESDEGVERPKTMKARREQARKEVNNDEE